MKMRHSVATWMSYTAMPKLAGGGDDESMGVMVDDRGGKHVEISMAIAAKNHGLGANILHREAEGVKLDGT